MKCPYCLKGKFEVIDSRNDDRFPVMRRRRCSRCKKAVTTEENVAGIPNGKEQTLARLQRELEGILEVVKDLRAKGPRAVHS